MDLFSFMLAGTLLKMRICSVLQLNSRGVLHRMVTYFLNNCGVPKVGCENIL